jgi:CheY-like chemotaxis protein
MDISQDSTDETPAQTDSGSAWVSACLTAMMERHGVSSRHQATLIAQICAISVSQARRKLRGAVWLFGEVLALCKHHGESLDAVFASQVLQVGHTGSPPPSSASLAHYPATLLIDGQRLPCDIQLGSISATTGQPLGQRTGQPPPGLLALHHPLDGWLVGSQARLAQEQITTPRYAVEQLQLHPAHEQIKARIAVLDDDAGSAGALTDWFNEVGFDAQAFTSAEQLLAEPLTEHDAYVVDLILAGGQTSQALVEQIRIAQPQAPIVLLTGQLRDGTASEATLATILRTQGVTFFEKPVRPAVLTAAIQSSLDRLSTTPHA